MEIHKNDPRLLHPVVPKTDCCVHPPSCGKLRPHFQVSLVLRVSKPMPPACIINSALDLLKITSVILDSHFHAHANL